MSDSKSLSPKFDVMVNGFSLRTKPEKGSQEMKNITGQIHRDFKNGSTVQLTIQEILEKLTTGHCVKLGSFKLQDYTPDEKRELRETYREDVSEYALLEDELKRKKQLELQSTKLLVLDIDDDKGSTEPEEVFNKSGATAMYYTFSHGEISVFLTKQKAYRLIFELDEAITDKGLLRFIQESLRDSLYQQFPALRPTEYDGKMVGGIDLLGDNFIFGSNKPNYQINEDAKQIEMRTYADERDAENELKEYTTAQTRYQKRNLNYASTDELKKMAFFLGDTSSLLSFKQWTTIAIGLWNSTANDISEETVLEVLRIIDGNKHDDSFYLGYKRPQSDKESTATIASFIKLATDNGYKRSYTAKYTDNGGPVIEPVIATETIKCKDYINVDDMMNLLKDTARRILLVSDTNSGKTYATIHACKKYLEEHEDSFVYFAAPTRALASQICSKYGLGESLQDDKQAYKLVQKAIENNSRIICGTYDKAHQVLHFLQAQCKLNLAVIVDEVHSETLYYGIRAQAINSLFNMVKSERVIKFIGLTGTPQEINLLHYDKRVLIEADKKEIAKELLFVEYNSENLFTSVTTQIIAQEVKQGSKVLCFVNNKKEIEIMKAALKKKFINATAITADTRKSRTYKNLLETEQFPENSSVLIATTVISDGINILNNEDYICVIAPRRISAPFFNLSQIKQASNRFRRTYKRLIIPLAIKEDLDDERLITKPYNLENRYQWLLAEANRTAEIIRKKFEPCLNFYKPSVAEALAGLFNTFLAKGFDFEKAYREDEKRTLGLKNYDSDLVTRLDKIKERLFTVDERAIRFQASTDKEEYYKYFHYAFKSEIAKITGISNVKNVLISEYLKPEDKKDSTSIATIIDALKELSRLADSEKREKIADILSESIFNNIQSDYYAKGKIDDDYELWHALKKALNSDHFITLKTTIGFLTYEQTLKELRRVTKRSQTHELLNHLKALEDLQFFKRSETANKRNKTQAILRLLEKAFADAGPLSVQERDLRIDEVIRTFKGPKEREAVTQCFNRFFVRTTPKAVKRDGKALKVSHYSFITSSFIMQYHDLTLLELEEIHDKLRYNRKMKH